MGDMAGSAERNSVQRSQSHPCDLPEQGPADVPDGCTLLVWNFRPRKGLDCPRRSVYATLSNSKKQKLYNLEQEASQAGRILWRSFPQVIPRRHSLYSTMKSLTTWIMREKKRVWSKKNQHFPCELLRGGQTVRKEILNDFHNFLKNTSTAVGGNLSRIWVQCSKNTVSEQNSSFYSQWGNNVLSI